jgi:hypothetical protein
LAHFSIATALGVTPGWLAFGAETCAATEESRDKSYERDIQIEAIWLTPQTACPGQADTPSPAASSIIIKIRR